jgi:hypothetical protein
MSNPNPIVIVTDRCFFTADQILHITLHELSFTKVASKRRYSLEITFLTPGTGNHPGGMHQNLNVPVTGTKDALKLFKTVVEQIREQRQDHLFLDKLFEKTFEVS